MSTTYYLSSVAVQSPISIGVDAKGRNIFSINFRCQSSGLPTAFEDDIMRVLATANLVVSGATGFIGPSSTIPEGDGPFILLRDTGGSAPIQSHNDDIYANLSVQITVYAKSYTIGRTRANAIWNVLKGKYNFSV